MVCWLLCVVWMMCGWVVELIEVLVMSVFFCDVGDGV